jgi:signal recognition particle subunit SRP54
MKMLPGMNQYADMINDKDASSAMKHTKAIIQSMTKAERENPAKIRSTMKRRIAKGSGSAVNDVNKLINQFNKMKKVMDQMGTLQRSGKLNEEYLDNMMAEAEGRGEQLPDINALRKRNFRRF